MFRIARAALILLILFGLAGGHWAVLQSIAWVNMFRDYSRASSFAQAAQETFSGDAPCAMCKKIDQARASENKTPLTIKMDKKIEIVAGTVPNTLPIRHSADHHFPAFQPPAFAGRTDPPPEPVPIV